MNKLIVSLTAVLLAVPCFAKTIIVDDDGTANYRKIQDAINASWDGDVIVVKPGTYRERITFNGRAVTVRSDKPDNPVTVQATVITSSTGATVTFDFDEGDRSVLEGFTITGRGILCLSASPTISKNVIRNCDGAGITGQQDAAPTILDNTILSNKQEGIYACAGLIRGNTISDNSAGAAFCSGLVRDNAITGNGPAGGLYFCDGEIAGNRIVGNYADSYGGGLYSCAAGIHNNVIAGNSAAREGGGLHDCTRSIVNNTIVGNRAGELGGGLSESPAVVRNNIVAFNEAPQAGGIYGECTNTYNAFWMNQGGNFAGGAKSGAGDIAVDPLFARDGHWDDRKTASLADDLWVDGDYHVKSQAGRWDPDQRKWVTDEETSRCIDAGNPSSDWSAELWPHGQRINIGAYGGTSQASMSLSEFGHLADLNNDAKVGWPDLKRLGQKWLLKEDCLAEDMNRDGTVDFADFAILGEQWRIGPRTASAPLPNPMTWATKPYATGAYSIAMVATKATSTDGTTVEYYFEDYYHPEYNSGWLAFGPSEEPRWQDTQLSAESTYWYHVKARNTGNKIETDWSQRSAAKTTQEDWTPPTPNPMTWEVQPSRVSAGTVRMTATTAIDESGVEYQFECTSSPAYSSGWQDSRTYEVGSLPKGHYTFTVRARDKSRNHNTTAYSVPAEVDLMPPTPDPMRWEIEPKEINIGGGAFDYCATMKAAEATDDAAGVEYYFQCTTESGFSSGWQTSREYTVKVGRIRQYHRFRVKARDTSTSHNETAYSSELPSK